MIPGLKEQFVVLVVDDNPDSLGMINMALNEEGMVVLVALNGQQALNVLDKVTPDVVLLDAMMPVMDGFACAKEIRKDFPLMPIIFMTGLSDEKDIVKGFEAGGTDYIIKPIRPQELLARIRQHSNSAGMLNEARKALDAVRQHVFSVSGSGELLWTTPEAEQLLARYQRQHADGERALQKRLSAWLPNGAAGYELALSCGEEVLTVRYFKQAKENEFLLKVQSADAEINPEFLEQQLQVTLREAEVLLWVAHGKTNREISEILDISPRTVNKHLEQIYPKIGADNRTAAASIAIQAIFGERIGRPGASLPNDALNRG